MAERIKMKAILNTEQCSLVEDKLFGRAYCLHLQGSETLGCFYEAALSIIPEGNNVHELIIKVLFRLKML
jgi:hypothetical protein